MPNRVQANENYPVIERSEGLWRRAAGLIPCGTQTMAKGPTQFSDGVAPKYLVRGRGARVWDADGNEYLDYNMGIGPIILGYCQPEVDAAIHDQLGDGITFSLMHPLEVHLAELIRECVPNAESVRFSKTGCDATSAAVRLARAFTGREKILCCGYHGWHDWYIGTTPRNAGIPRGTLALTDTFTYNDIDSLREKLDNQTACVILEPFAFEAPRDGFLQALRGLCDVHGALLVFDEMWTGFRCALGGAQELYGVNADLALFSKAIANGMPISVICGRREVMAKLEDDVFFFTTFGGEALSLAAAVACINFIREHKVPAYIAEVGARLMHGLNDILSELALDGVSVTGYPFRSIVNFAAAAGEPLMMKTLVQQELIKHGILWTGMHNICYAHTAADVDYTLEAYGSALATLKSALQKGDLASRLRGKVLQPVFKRTPASGR